MTGISGFLGHHFAEDLLKNTDWEIIGIDRLDYASADGFDKLRDVDAYDNDRVKLYVHDLTTPIREGLAKEIGEIDYVFHLAAGSHVDNSIKDPVPFVQNNVNSTLYMLEYARELKGLKKFVYFSTDEVFGTAPEGVDYKEGDRMNPGNPYSASKAASECICMSYANTYKVPIIITNTMNIIGERQHPEKFFPLVINKTLDGETVYIHGNSDKTEAGKRHYLHARNIGAALRHIILNTDEVLDAVDCSKGRFNVVGEKEFDNLTFAKTIARAVGKDVNCEIVDFHSSRPGHDLRYALDGNKLEASGFVYPVSVDESIVNIVNWSLKKENLRWLGRSK